MYARGTVFNKIKDGLNLNTGAMRLLTFFFTVFTCVHLVACLWVIMASLYDNSDITWTFNA
jgi:hypothetical protein